MLTKDKMDRINHLAKKKKNEGLTEDEKLEQNNLRQEYLEKFRENFKGHLNQIKYVEDMTPEELAEYKKQHQQ